MQNSLITTIPDQNMCKSDFFPILAALSYLWVLFSEQFYTMGFLLHQHKEKYFELVMNKLSVDMWTILVLINRL